MSPQWGDLKDSKGNYLPEKKHFFGRIDQIAYEIAQNLLFWKISVRQFKEKFGYVRIYCSFGFFDLFHDIFYPGYVYFQGVKWYNKWVLVLSGFLTYKTPLVRWLNLVIVPFHRFIYRRAYKKAIKKYPKFKKYILGDADWDEYLKNL